MTDHANTAADTSIALADALPRDREVQDVVLRLVSAYAFAEAHAVLALRLREIAQTRQTRIEQIYIDWTQRDPSTRSDFLTFAHCRRTETLSPPEKD